MPEDQEGFAGRLAAITVAADVPALREAVIAVMRSLGFEAAYFVTPPKADSRSGRIVSTIGLSPAWDRHYRSCLHPFDPLPELALDQVGAFTWPDALDGDRIEPRQRKYLEMAARFGLGRGVGTMCYGPHGRSGFLGMLLPEGMPDPGAVMCVQVHTIGQLAFQRYCMLIRSDEDMPRLSGRELEVLRLIAMGKSNGVIADVLEIAPTSVDAYVRRIFAKMGVSDRTTASVKAQSLGLIVAWDHERLMKEAAERLAHF